MSVCERGSQHFWFTDSPCPGWQKASSSSSSLEPATQHDVSQIVVVVVVDGPDNQECSRQAVMLWRMHKVMQSAFCHKHFLQPSAVTVKF